jgi:hypothetical protein
MIAGIPEGEAHAAGSERGTHGQRLRDSRVHDPQRYPAHPTELGVLNVRK